MSKTNLKIVFLIIVMFLVGGVVSKARADVVACSFYRDLSIGSRGEDVLCLQRYLQSYGYGSTFSSYGSPDGVFGPLTQQSVMQWQTRSGLLATGYFDANSRSRFNNGYTGGRVLGASTSYLNQNVYYGNINTIDGRAWNKIQEALEMIQDAEEAIFDSNKNTSSAKNKLDDAKDDMIDAAHAYFVDRDYNEALDKANDALDNAENAYDDVDGSRNNNGTRTSAKNAIDDARDAIDNAKDEIDYAYNRGRNVRNANALLDDAKNKLDNAENKYDDKNYSKAEDYANDAEDLANEAIDMVK